MANSNETTPRFFTQVPTSLNGLGLSSTDKLVFGCVYTMLNVTGKCFMSNARIGENVEVKPNTVAKSLNKLESIDLISRTVIYKKDSKIIDKRYITLGQKLFQNSSLPIGPESNTLLDKNPIPIGQKSKDNKSLNKSTNKGSSKDERTTKVEKDEQDVIQYLNDKLNGGKFKKSKELRGRLEEGYTPKQLKQVIYYCAVTQKWLTSVGRDGVPMLTYLRPKTLFGKENCKGYLESAETLHAAQHANQQQQLLAASNDVDKRSLYS